MRSGLPAADWKALVLPETVPIPAGRLDLRKPGGSVQSVEIAEFRLGRTAVTNRE